MNDASVAEQKQIFEAPLGSAEQEAINALVSKHKANAAVTQQLALDASKLVASSQERLAQQSGAGFFKRLANAISGKTSENQQLNQSDMLQMQKFAWHYLQQLQQQNLINAQSIAVIRNNLGVMNEYIIETRDFLEQAIDKIDHRLRHLENNASFVNWALNIEANKRRFKSLPKNLLILRLTYDFQRSHQHVLFIERDVSNYLVTTLEKLEVNCDEEIKLLDFISELIDQIEIVGLEQYRSLIAVLFDEHVVESDFLQKNISGIGFNALYYLSDQYERIIDLIGDEQLCNSDEAREKIISKFFGKEFSGLTTAYSIRHLMCEIIGATQVAIDVYKDQHGLNAAPQAVTEAPQQEEPVILFSALPEIHAHTYFDSGAGDQSKRDYLLLFALCVENSASFKAPAREFLSLLVAKAGQADVREEILRLADNPRKLNDYQPVMQALLDREDKKLTWLLDAFFLLALDGKPVESPQIKSILGILKPAQLKECLPQLLAIIGDSDESKVLELALKLTPSTQAWKNVVRYRELRFDKYFAEPLKRLQAASWANTLLILEMSEVYRKGMEHAYFISYSDGSFMDNLAEKAASTLCAQGRKSALAGLNEFRKKTTAFLSEHRSALSQGNNVISRWNISSFEFKDDTGYSDFDLDNSAKNEDWGDQFQLYYDKLEGMLNSFDGACGNVVKQIEFFVEGDFDQSVLALREQQRAESLRKQEQEKLEKQSVVLVKDGQEHLFRIDWQQVDNPPCDPQKITHIKTDGKIWVIVASINSDEVLYRSEDGVVWQKIQLDLPQFKIWLDKIDFVNGLWIVKNRALRAGTREEGCYYSSDALVWQHSSGPDGENQNQGYENLVYFNGMWLWATSQRKKYSYTEKGFFSDSTNTDTYRTLLVFCAPTLDGPWQLWEHTPQLPEGAGVKTICSLPENNALLVFCEYDSSYIRNKKKPENPPFVKYFGAGKSWQTSDWDSSRSFYGSDRPVITQLDGKLMYFCSGEILVSAKGYDWQRQATTLHVDEHFALNGVSLFTSGGCSGIYLSQDGEQFKEIALDDGRWRYLTANDGGMLGIHYANKHEETVLRVGRNICQPKL